MLQSTVVREPGVQREAGVVVVVVVVVVVTVVVVVGAAVVVLVVVHTKLLQTGCPSDPHTQVLQSWIENRLKARYEGCVLHLCEGGAGGAGGGGGAAGGAVRLVARDVGARRRGVNAAPHVGPVHPSAGAVHLQVIIERLRPFNVRPFPCSPVRCI